MNIIHGDCLEELKKLDDNSIDAVITDPPYGLSNTKPQQVADVLKAWVTGDAEAAPTTKGGFMNADWDSFVPPPAVWEECMRVLKPGGHMAVFAGARTQDLMGLSIRLAGFEIRDTLGWVYGSGMPKSHNISKAIDKAAGAERKVVGSYDRRSVYDNRNRTSVGAGSSQCAVGSAEIDLTTPASDAAKQWDGWGTALKPAIEPIILARKPLDGTVASNVLAHGVGGLNIDACRVEPLTGAEVARSGKSTNGGIYGKYESVDWRSEAKPHPGRFPANVLLDEHAAKEMDKQSGVSVSRVRKHRDSHVAKESTAAYGDYGVAAYDRGTSDEGGASRFFPVFKSEEATPEPKGRFPANVLLDEYAAEEMDEQSGVLKSGGGNKAARASSSWFTSNKDTVNYVCEPDSGGASRYFPVFKYQAKAPKKERPVIEREAIYGLRDDLTEDQVDYVLARLREAGVETG